MRATGNPRSRGRTNQTRAVPKRRAGKAPLTVSRPELLEDGSDRMFRELVHAFFAFQARHEIIRNAHAARIGLPGVQYTLLIAIAHLEAEGDVSASTLCSHLRVSSAFVAVELAKLVERGLVSRRRDPRDARRLLLGTLHAGRALLASLAPTQRRVNDLEFAGLTRTDFRNLHRILTLLIGNCEAAISLQRRTAKPAKAGSARPTPQIAG